MSLFVLLSDLRILVAVLVGALGLAFLVNASRRSRPYVVWFAGSALLFATTQAAFRVLEIDGRITSAVAAPGGSFVALIAWAAIIVSLQRFVDPAGGSTRHRFVGALVVGVAIVGSVIAVLRPWPFAGPVGVSTLFTLTSAWVLLLWRRQRWGGLLLLSAAFLIHPALLGMAIAGDFSVYQFRLLTPVPIAAVYVLVATLILQRDAQALDDELRQRRAAEARLQELADGLDEQVRERTGQLEELVGGLQSFAGMVSHDLRGPLGNVQGLAEMTREALDANDGRRARELLDLLEHEAGRATATVADLLTLARADQGPAVRRPVDVGGLVADCIDALAREHPRSREVVHAQALPTVALDGALFRHALANLIGNALKFGAARPDLRVDVSARREGDGWRFEVRDNGPGFDPARAGELFRPFVRLDARGTPGTGLGLTVVRRVVERHGGRVGADSAPGAGASFWWTLPDPDGAAHEARQPGAAVAH